MLHFPKWKIATILIVLLVGTILAIPSLMPRATLEQMPGWFPKQTVSLGLDLQGGSHLLLEVDMRKLVSDRLAGVLDETRTALRKANIGYTDLAVRNDRVTLNVRDTGSIETAREQLQPLVGEGMELSADGTRLSIGYSEAGLTQLKQHTVEQSIEIVRRRIDETGTREPTIIRQGEDRIVVQVPGVTDPEHLKKILRSEAKLTFHMVQGPGGAGAVPPTMMDLPEADTGQLLRIEKRPLVEGENLVDAQQSFDQGGLPVVSFKFDSLGARKFGDATSKNVGRRFAIVLDDKIISAPVIRDAILGGSGIISGSFTVESARDLALLLRAGALPAPLTVIEERTVGADLGADSIEAGKRACIIALVGIVVAMVLLYGIFGVFANIALIFNGILILGALSALGATLTLPGIAGIVLTLGMAVDANVLILERVREEMRNGRSAVTSMEFGYREALATIIDANVTTLISTLLLFSFGTGPIKGFAVTLTIGILVSMFTALMFTQLMTSVWLRRTRPKVLPL
ncbi:protein translocase subunit SecD [Dongia deserti]|uniref:protein translocase subunit SecD n=1 Tax=Dongia deserti TaxID=2268030 RepID=UPI000E658161|nr:protein translocase subunit SecD [Dongia deserti]